MCIDDVGGLL